MLCWNVPAVHRTCPPHLPPAQPLAVDHPLVQMENVILTPHALAWTDDLYEGNSLGACQNVLTVLQGDTPRYVVNRDVLGQSGKDTPE